MYPSQRASKVAELPTRPIDLSGKRIVLLLQGGGALGGYQVGAFEALQAHLETIGRKIDWVVGISIGAINAAVIAGNRPEDLRPQYQPEGLLLNKDGKSRAPAIRPDRPSKLESLWKDILWPPADWLSPWSREYDSWLKACSAICSWSPLAPLVGKYIGWNLAAWGGQRNFFRSRLLSWENPWFAEFWRSPLPPGEAANYDTAPLRGLLTDPDKRYVDWDLINSPSGIQLSLGATDVEFGEMRFFSSFDSSADLWKKTTITASHVMASGALPPAFPPVQFDEDGSTKYYWDGGLFSNTPLQELQNEFYASDKPIVIFDILVWDRRGLVPRTMDESMWRQKCIQFGSRKRVAELIVENYENSKRPGPGLCICQVMYEYDSHSPTDAGDAEFAMSDAEFSHSAFMARRTLGRQDMQKALSRPWPVFTGHNASLYRVGTLDKHVETDQWAREAVSMRGFSSLQGEESRRSSQPDAAWTDLREWELHGPRGQSRFPASR